MCVHNVQGIINTFSPDIPEAQTPHPSDHTCALASQSHEDTSCKTLDCEHSPLHTTPLQSHCAPQLHTTAHANPPRSHLKNMTIIQVTPITLQEV